MGGADDGTTSAASPQRWVCAACGKTSAARYGFDAEQRNVADPGWDESCALNAVLCEPTGEPLCPWDALYVPPREDSMAKLEECVAMLQRVARGQGGGDGE